VKNRGALERLLLIILASSALWCGSLPASWAAEKEPDLSPMVEFVGKFGMAHGCPVGPWDIYTAAHVTDEEPLKPETPLFPLRMQDGTGHEDVAVPIISSNSADLALMRPLHDPLAYWFQVAPAPPQPGDKLWNVGYHWDSRKEFAKARVVVATVIRTVAGHVALDRGAGPGSSGACWVNAKGQAVAIEIWGMDCDEAEVCAMAVGLWGPWRFTEEKR
jgi:hypothetical protein